MDRRDAMTGDFLSSLQQDPPPAFATGLRQRLREVEREAYHDRPASMWRAVAGPLAAAAVVAALLAIPAVRAQAQAFLDLFRVVNFTAVPVDVARIDALGERGLDLEQLLGQRAEVSPAGPAQPYVTVDLASEAIGYRLRMPELLPNQLILTTIEVKGERSMRITADTQLLGDVMQALGIADLSPPSEIDGQIVQVRVPPIARVIYTSGDREIAWLQARSPEVVMPAGINLSALGEIGLRIAGLPAREAHTLAQAIDWSNTLTVPVPALASTFQQVDVHGVRGLLVSSTERPDTKALLWAEQGFVYGLTGDLSDRNMLLMAESVR